METDVTEALDDERLASEAGRQADLEATIFQNPAIPLLTIFMYSASLTNTSSPFHTPLPVADTRP